MTGEVSIKGVLCVIPTMAGPLRVIPSGRYPNSPMGVCDLELAEEEISASLNQEWLAKGSALSETSKTKGFFTRRAFKVEDSRVSWLEEKIGGGLSIPYAEVGKVTGRKRKGGSDLRKKGNPVEYVIRFDFNKGEHFWSESYVEVWLTAGEYATIRECLIAKPGLAGRTNFGES